ncbi:MAG: M2 family metallopeptidase [Candidatus Sericytochromatia bacterium]
MNSVEKELQEFIDKHVSDTQQLRKELYHASWDFEVTGTEESKNRRMDKELELTRIYADKERFDKLKALKAKENEILDHDLKRHLELFYNSFESEQKDEELLSKIIEVSTDINDKYNNFRGHVDGKKVSNNDILEVLENSTDNELRKKYWEASKEIGEEVAGEVIEVVKLRNQVAQKLGYKNHYEMSLKQEEIDYNYLFNTLDKLKELTDEPFRKAKNKLDNVLAKRFGITVEELRPWHYSDPFFQESVNGDGLNLDHVFSTRDAVEMNIKFYDGIGLETRDMLAKSDLYAREHKSQHAFCTDLDKEGDVRILCNIIQNEKWVSTTLHELGHAVYDKYLPRELPFYLRSPAHTMSTEAIAMLMGRLTKNAEWLNKIANLEHSEIETHLPDIKEQYRLGMLIFVRWGLVMVNFERELYNNPDQDLKTLWWDLVEKFQFVKRPENRHKSDWASKLHLALAPVYYQNYILGELIASQLEYFINNKVEGKTLVENKSAGDYLVKEYFSHGARYDWNELLEKSTGEKLNPEFFIHEFLDK